MRVKTWTRHTEKFHTYRDFEVYDEKNNLVAIASSKWVLVNLETGRITRLDETIMNRYQPEERSVFGEIQTEIEKLKEPDHSTSAYLYRVQRSNIDINNHMHNLYYLDLAYETLPEEVYLQSDFQHVEIMYKHEIKLADTVKCLYAKVEDAHYVTIKSEDEKCLHAIIKLS